MSRTAPFLRLLKPLSLLTAFCALALLPGTARAGAYTYSTGSGGSPRTVNAGILLLNDSISGNAYPTVAQGADNKDPYVFYLLNQRSDVKPFGWNIVNPLALPSVTSDVYQRWQNRTPTAVGPAYRLGQTLSPAMAAYWEVPLKTTTDLSKFDILLLNLEQVPAFTAADSEKLRRFVDGGGTLWLENSGTSAASPVPGLFFNLSFENPGGAGTAYVPAFIRPPLITVPYQLSEQELDTLGDKHIGGYYADDGSGVSPHDISGRLTFATVVGNTAHGNLPVVAEAAYGAGEIVITTTGSADAINEYVGGVDVGVGGNSGPFCGVNTQVAPTADLKLLADIIASTESHTNEHQNSHQTGSDVGALPSAVQTWSYSPSGTATALPAGAVSSGHIAYAVVGGNLVAFDLYPAEDLDGNGNPDDGTPDFNSGVPYDTLWAKSVGASASAPTIAMDGTTPAVFVEQGDGTVQEYHADITGAPIYHYQDGASGGHGAYSTQAAPAPTIYDGRVYAGQHDGTLYVSPLQGTGQAFPVDSSITGGATPYPILAAPTVGIIPDDSSGTVPTNDIVALCVTQQGLFSVFLGSRGELLNRAGAAGSYNTKLRSLTGTLMDVSGVQRSYTLDPTTAEAIPSGATVSSSSPNFTGGPATGLHADYDVDFGATPTTANLTRTFAGASGQSAMTPASGAYAGAYVSTPALDRLGNVYYTVTDANGSSLVSVHDGPTQNRVHMNWRFLLPTQGLSAGVDADGASYDTLQGYKFVTASGGTPVASAPVVDAQGNVYVLATSITVPTVGTNSPTNPGPVAILAFNSQGTISTDAVAVGGQAGGVNSVSITQPINGTTDEFGGNPTALSPSQYTLSTTGHIEFTDFSQHLAGMNGTGNIFPDLNEPYPLTVGFSIGGAATTQNQNLRPLHTNVSWFTAGSASTAASGLTLVGGTLYFVDGAGYLTSLPADPASAGFSVTNKFVPPNPTAGAAPLFTTIDNANVGVTTAVPSAGNGALLVNGPRGLTAYTNQVTLVVDANRVLEMNASGDAEWAVDSTSKTTLAGDTSSIYTGNGTPGNGQYVTTTLELNRPTSLTELTANDYLVADTGNNRCVRFDRGGKVLWELTKFNDPNNLLKPGEPNTLNQPTSVQITSGYDSTSGSTTVRYLISDTGNYRIVEIDDTYDSKFNLTGNHVLNWTSHTHDVQGRDYRYQSAAYYASPVSGKYYVVALVTNKRIAPFTAPALTAAQYGQAAPGLLSPANQDAGGGTIVLLDYDTAHPYGSVNFGFNNQADGFIGIDPSSSNLIAVSTIKAYLTANGSFDLSTTLAPTAASTLQTLYIRNPRYLKVVTKSVTTATGTNSERHYLLADDNGVWDLNGTTFLAQWGFTQTDYRGVTTPISQDGVTGTTLQNGTASQVPFIRTVIPFVPTAVQLTGTDLISGNLYGRYLITNSFSQGEAANNTGNFGSAYNTTGTSGLPTTAPIPGFGGEVFEVHVINNGGLQSVETHDNPSGSSSVPPTTGGALYTGHTISRPTGTNTSPLSQPTFAYRLQF